MITTRNGDGRSRISGGSLETGDEPPIVDVPASTPQQRARRRKLLYEYSAAKLKYLGWQLLSKLGLGLIYFNLIAEGARTLVPFLGTKLHKTPGLAALNDYELTYKLDLAHAFAIGLLIAIWHFGCKLIRLWLDPDTTFVEEGWNEEAHVRFVYAIGVPLLLVDAAFFFTALQQFGWNDEGFSFSSLLATAAYVGVLFYVCYVTVSLRRPVVALKQELRDQ